MYISWPVGEWLLADIIWCCETADTSVKTQAWRPVSEPCLQMFAGGSRWSPRKEGTATKTLCNCLVFWTPNRGLFELKTWNTEFYFHVQLSRWQNDGLYCGKGTSNLHLVVIRTAAFPFLLILIFLRLIAPEWLKLVPVAKQFCWKENYFINIKLLNSIYCRY